MTNTLRRGLFLAGDKVKDAIHELESVPSMRMNREAHDFIAMLKQVDVLMERELEIIDNEIGE